MNSKLENQDMKAEKVNIPDKKKDGNLQKATTDEIKQVDMQSNSDDVVTNNINSETQDQPISYEE